MEKHKIQTNIKVQQQKYMDSVTTMHLAAVLKDYLRDSKHSMQRNTGTKGHTTVQTKMSKKYHRNAIKKQKGNTGKEQHTVQTQISEITVGAAWSDHLSALTQKHSLSLSTRQEKEKVLSLKSIMIIIKIMIIINNFIFIDIV